MREESLRHDMRVRLEEAAVAAGAGRPTRRSTWGGRGTRIRMEAARLCADLEGRFGGLLPPAGGAAGRGTGGSPPLRMRRRDRQKLRPPSAPWLLAFWKSWALHSAPVIGCGCSCKQLNQVRSGTTSLLCTGLHMLTGYIQYCPGQCSRVGACDSLQLQLNVLHFDRHERCNLSRVYCTESDICADWCLAVSLQPSTRAAPR